MIIGYKPDIYNRTASGEFSAYGFYLRQIIGGTLVGRNNLTNGRPSEATIIRPNNRASQITLVFSVTDATYWAADTLLVCFLSGIESTEIGSIDFSGSIMDVVTGNDGVTRAADILSNIQPAGSATITLHSDSSWFNSDIMLGEAFIGRYLRVKCIADEYTENRTQRSSIARSVGGQVYARRRPTTEGRRVVIAGMDYGEQWGDGQEPRLDTVQYALSCMDSYRPMFICPFPDGVFGKLWGHNYNGLVARHGRIAYSVGDTQLSVTPPYFRTELDLEIPPELGRR